MSIASFNLENIVAVSGEAPAAKTTALEQAESALGDYNVNVENIFTLTL